MKIATVSSLGAGAGRSNPRRWSLAVALLVAAAPAVAHAEPAPSDAAPAGDNVEVARSHFLRGVQFYNAGDYKLSLEEFRRSYELSQNYRILYNIGQVHQQLNNYARALAALERYLAEGGADVPEARRSEVSNSIVELKRKVAYVVLVTNVAQPEVLVDGFPTPERDSTNRLTLDPGDHRVELRKAGYQPSTSVLTLAAGDTTELRLHLVPSPAADRHASPAAQGAKHEQSLPWLGWVATGVLAAGAGVMGVLATNQASELSSLRTSVSTQAQRDKVAKRAHTYAIACDALGAAALVSGGISLYLTLHSSGPKRHEAAAETTLVLSPSRVALSGSF